MCRIGQHFTCRLDRNGHKQMHPDLHEEGGSRCRLLCCRVLWWWWAPLPRSGASAGYLAKQQERARRHGQARVCRKYRANVRRATSRGQRTGSRVLQHRRCLQEARHAPALIRQLAAAEKRPNSTPFRHRRLEGRLWTSLMAEC